MSFEDWLDRNGYRESTRRATCRHVAAARAAMADGEEPSSYLAGAIRRWMAWGQDEAIDNADLDQLHDLGYRPVTPATGPKEARKTPRRSFADEDWVALLQALEADGSRESSVLLLMAVTSLRVGDVLAIPFDAIDQGLETGVVAVERKGGRFVEVPTEGSYPEWETVHRGMTGGGFTGDLVASYVCSRRRSSPLAAEAAYQRVNRHLKAVGRDLSLPSPVHLHRIRRTVAVHALRTTKDMTQVQQLLGHSSLSSTERYLDELRTQDVGRLQRKLGKYRVER